MNLEDAIFPTQNCREIYLLQMDQTIETVSTETAVPLRFLETNYQEYEPKQNVTQFVTSALPQPGQIEVLPVLRPQNDLVQYIQLKLEKPVQCDIDTLIPTPTQFVAPSEISSTHINNILNAEHNNSMLNNCNNLSTECMNDSNSIKHNYIHISDRIVPQRAVAVLPPALQIKRGVVTPRRLLPPYVRFGPVQGVKRTLSYLRADELISTAAASKTPVFLLKQDNDYFTHIDVSDKDKSNWMCLLPLATESTPNVWIYEENNELYGITTESIHPRKPLTLGYSKSYAEECGLPDGQPLLDLRETHIGQRQWWCYECRKPMSSETQLQKHREAHHKDGSQRRKRYNCRHCKKTFCRLYTMKRHVMTRFCLKNSKQTSDAKQTKQTREPPDVGLNITQSTDDNRMPSDESFQNYSNGLDFSTNLFDDRMPSLDISGNSRGEEFNPYTMDREGNLVGDLGFSNGLDCAQNTHLEISILENATEPQEYAEPAVTLSERRKQTPARKKKKQYSTECKQQNFECKCGRFFNTKDKLTKHMLTVCTVSRTPQTDPVPSESKYKCEDCQVSFKRRGMLVNHLWRVHNTAPTAVPVEKRIRHYPCVACPKIYRSAAKRDSHVILHHPESRKLRAAPIEGGVVRGEAAACAACPRQYGSRAKLLQHLRQQHPHLAPLPKNKQARQNKKVS